MKLLFICTHNACRSILAEALARDIAEKTGAALEVRSAGSAPAGHLHPLTLHYLEKHGLSAEGLQSQSWDDLEDFAPDAVITVCDRAAGESCPVWFGRAARAHWGLPDPSRPGETGPETDKVFAAVIAALKESITTLAAENTEGLAPDDLAALLARLAPKVTN